jgi:hypothetical protein
MNCENGDISSLAAGTKSQLQMGNPLWFLSVLESCPFQRVFAGGLGKKIEVSEEAASSPR